MDSTRKPRIVIEDLPPLEQLSEEELARILGAGRGRLGIETLESRELMASGLTANLPALLANFPSQVSGIGSRSRGMIGDVL